MLYFKDVLQDVELLGGIVNADGAAADLTAVQHQVVVLAAHLRNADVQIKHKHVWIKPNHVWIKPKHVYIYTFSRCRFIPVIQEVMRGREANLVRLGVEQVDVFGHGCGEGVVGGF